jgi:hypothetical protein
MSAMAWTASPPRPTEAPGHWSVSQIRPMSVASSPSSSGCDLARMGQQGWPARLLRVAPPEALGPVGRRDPGHQTATRSSGFWCPVNTFAWLAGCWSDTKYRAQRARAIRNAPSPPANAGLSAAVVPRVVLVMVRVVPAGLCVQT